MFIIQSSEATKSFGFLFLNFSIFFVSSRDVLQHESDPAHKGGHEADASAALADNIEIEKDSTSDSEGAGMDTLHQQEDKTHDEMIELADSEDDLATVVPRNIGLRRNLKMIIDAEDDD